jgi:uncharacterized protein
MKCDEVSRLLNAYVDGELALERSLAVEEHVAGCARCRAVLDGQDALRSALGRACTPERAPDRLRARVQARLRLGAGGAAPGEPGRHSMRSWLIAAPGVVALMILAVLLIARPWNPGATAAPEVTRVVYHIASANDIGASLRTLRNHLDAEPRSQIVVVAHNSGIEFLLQGAHDESGGAYAEAVRAFRARGVDFRVCTNTLTRRKIDPVTVIREAVLVPSGIAEISRLQGQEGYVYLRL